MSIAPGNSLDNQTLPALPFDAWKDTQATLHMWTQIVGKVRLSRCPLVNHWWNVPLYVTARGLTTSLMPAGSGGFEVTFDFVSHKLLIETCDGASRELPLRPQSVADFYKAFTAALDELGVGTKIWTTPCEIPDPIPFERDNQHCSYDPDSAHKFWRILAWSNNVFHEFRAPFLGKVSPVHFFWGSFDLAVTRFSGRRAPERPAPMPSRARPIRMKSAARDSGRAAVTSKGPHIIPMPLLSRTVLPTNRCDLRPLSTIHR